MRKAWAGPEKRARKSEASRKLWADPEYRCRMSEAARKTLFDPEVRHRTLEAVVRYGPIRNAGIRHREIMRIAAAGRKTAQPPSETDEPRDAW
jgi:hypothetical protein